VLCRGWSSFAEHASSWSAFCNAIISGSLIISTAIVTGPICVSALSSGPSHTKCSVRLTLRGWKRRTISPVSGSSPAMLGPLEQLLWMQARARFSYSFVPPCCRAMTGSIWNRAGWNVPLGTATGAGMPRSTRVHGAQVAGVCVHRRRRAGNLFG